MLVDMNLTIGDAVFRILTAEPFRNWRKEVSAEKQDNLYDFRSRMIKLKSIMKSKEKENLDQFITSSKDYLFQMQEQRYVKRLYNDYLLLFQELEEYQKNKTVEQEEKVLKIFNYVIGEFEFKFNRGIHIK